MGARRSAPTLTSLEPYQRAALKKGFTPGKLYYLLTPYVHSSGPQGAPVVTWPWRRANPLMFFKNGTVCVLMFVRDNEPHRVHVDDASFYCVTMVSTPAGIVFPCFDASTLRELKC